MLTQLKIILIKLIDNYYAKKKKLQYVNRKYKKNALVSYVIVPKTFIGNYFRSSHNNKIQCYLLLKYLRSKGYNVYLHSYLDENRIDYSIEYDLFIGHNITFATIAGKLKGNFKKLLIVTGSEPNFGNNQQRRRIEELNNRKQTKQFVYTDNIVPDLSLNYEIADSILMLGNKFVKDTYPQKYHSKVRLINNITMHPFFSVKREERNNNFLFISSVGQIHRGLDLVLDVFSGLKNKLYILSSFEKEPEFVDLYYNQLYRTLNILPVGYLPLNSKKFQEIINDIDFVILPSCSEGQSSSIINILAYGKIPVIPENVGIPDVEEIGIKIKKIDIEGVQSAVSEAISLSDGDFLEKQNKISKHNQLYLPESFTSSLKAVVQ